LIPSEWVYQCSEQKLLEQYWSKTHLKVSLHDQKNGVQCGITAATVVGRIFFEQPINSGWYASDIPQPSFESIMEEERRWLLYARWCYSIHYSFY
jgi:hypothetical protein